MKDTIESVKIISVLLNNFIDELKKSTIYVDEATELKFDIWSSELKTIIDLQSKPETDDELLEFMLKNIFVENESDLQKELSLLELENSRQLRETKIKQLEDSVALELKTIKAKQELAEKTSHITKEIITLLNSNPEIKDQLSDFIHQAKTAKAFEVFENGIEHKIVKRSGKEKITTLDESKKIDLKTNQAFNRSDKKLKMLTDEDLIQVDTDNYMVNMKELINNLPIDDSKKKLLLSNINHIKIS